MAKVTGADGTAYATYNTSSGYFDPLEDGTTGIWSSPFGYAPPSSGPSDADVANHFGISMQIWNGLDFYE